jgi:hypothetical protein
VSAAAGWRVDSFCGSSFWECLIASEVVFLGEGFVRRLAPPGLSWGLRLDTWLASRRLGMQV